MSLKSGILITPFHISYIDYYTQCEKNQYIFSRNVLTHAHKLCILTISTRNVSERSDIVKEMNPKIIGEKLVKLRGNKTQEEVAKSLKISVSALSMYERGERIPRDNIKIRISEYYKKPIHRIFFS